MESWKPHRIRLRDSESLLDRIRRYLVMTKVGQLFEDEKIRAVKEATEEVMIKATEKALKQGLSFDAIGSSMKNSVMGYQC